MDMANSTKAVPRSPCVISNVLDLFGDRWTFLILRDLFFFQKHEYKQFLESPESIATNILADRLKRLKNAAIIEEASHPTNKSRKLYYLTQKGKDLLPILIEMIIWGGSYLPKNEVMEPLCTRVKADPAKFKAQVLRSLEESEHETLAPTKGSAG